MASSPTKNCMGHSEEQSDEESQVKIIPYWRQPVASGLNKLHLCIEILRSAKYGIFYLFDNVTYRSDSSAPAEHEKPPDFCTKSGGEIYFFFFLAVFLCNSLYFTIFNSRFFLRFLFSRILTARTNRTMRTTRTIITLTIV